MTKLSYPIGFFLKHAEPFLKKYSFSTAYEKYDEVLLLNDYCKLKVVLDKVSVDLYILDPTERYRFVALHVAALLLDPDEYTRTLESCGLKNILYPDATCVISLLERCAPKLFVADLPWKETLARNYQESSALRKYIYTNGTPGDDLFNLMDSAPGWEAKVMAYLKKNNIEYNL